VANIQTTAKKTADGKFYVVNGYKKWITGMPTATHMTTAVRTGGPGMAGISVIVIPVDSKGFSHRRISNSGQKGGGASFVELDDVHVPVENLLGKENEGFRIIMTNFNTERFIMSVGCNRKARTCLSESFEYASKRHTFGKPLIANQIIAHKLATIGRYVESHWAWLEQLAYHIAGQIALAKVHGGRILEMANREAQQIFGGAGYQRSGPGAIIEQMSRDLRMMVRSMFAGCLLKIIDSDCVRSSVAAARRLLRTLPFVRRQRWRRSEGGNYNSTLRNKFYAAESTLQWDERRTVVLPCTQIIAQIPADIEYICKQTLHIETIWFDTALACGVASHILIALHDHDVSSADPDA
jgi:hypothetical protein